MTMLERTYYYNIVGKINRWKVYWKVGKSQSLWNNIIKLINKLIEMFNCILLKLNHYQSSNHISESNLNNSNSHIHAIVYNQKTWQYLIYSYCY